MLNSRIKITPPPPHSFFSPCFFWSRYFSEQFVEAAIDRERSSRVALAFSNFRLYLTKVRRDATAKHGSITVNIGQDTPHDVTTALLDAVSERDCDSLARPFRVEIDLEIVPFSHVAEQSLAHLFGDGTGSLVVTPKGWQGAIPIEGSGNGPDAATRSKWNRIGRLLAKCVMFNTVVTIPMNSAFFHCLVLGYESMAKEHAKVERRGLARASIVQTLESRKEYLDAAHEGFVTAFEWKDHLESIGRDARDLGILFAPQSLVDAGSVIHLLRTTAKDDPQFEVKSKHLEFMKVFLKECQPVVLQQFLIRATGTWHVPEGAAEQIDLRVRKLNGQQDVGGQAVTFERVEAGQATTLLTVPHCADQEMLRHRMHRALNTDEDKEVECCICTEPFYEADGIRCEEVEGAADEIGHFMCAECLEGHVRVKCTIDNENSGQAIAMRKAIVECGAVGCSNELKGERITQIVTTPTASLYRKAQAIALEFAVENKLRPQMQEAMNVELKRLAALTAKEREEIKHRNHILENFLTPRCQKVGCGAAFIDWTDCSKLHCRSCQGLFCANCWEPIGHLSDPYLHVRECAGAVYGDRVQIKVHWQGRAKRQVDDYLRQNVNAEVAAKIRTCIPKEEEWFEGLKAEGE